MGSSSLGTAVGALCCTCSAGTWWAPLGAARLPAPLRASAPPQGQFLPRRAPAALLPPNPSPEGGSCEVLAQGSTRPVQAADGGFRSQQSPHGSQGTPQPGRFS